MPIEIRPERPDDASIIFDLTATAFEPMAFSDGTEAQLTHDLRADGDLTLSLVATDANEIVGHIAFSPVTIAGDHKGWFGLGPISVWPDRQFQGIGSLLIHAGLAELKAQGAAGCALVGNPDFYGRFGFKSEGLLQYGDVPARLVQWISFGEDPERGLLKFSPAFET